MFTMRIGLSAIIGFWLAISVFSFAAAAPGPRSAEDYLKRGNTRYTERDLDGAIADYNRAIEINSRFARTPSDRTDKAYNLGSDGSTAVSGFGRITVMDPFNASALYNRGLARYAKRDLEGAIADYTTAIKIDPRHATAHIRRGMALQARGDLDRAIADYNRAIALDPSSALAHNNRGI